MLIDTHCHLTDERFADIGEVLRTAGGLGVEKVIMPSTDVADAKRAIEIAERENQYCLLGIHPENAEKIVGVDEEMNEMKKQFGSKTVVGIGEIGLDYYWDKEKKTEEKQVDLFRRQMALAVELSLPVAIHMRGSEEEMRSEILGMKKLPRGQFHCFAGSSEFLEMILSLGFYVSFGGNITYKSAGNLRELLKNVPPNRLLLETDSPYLPPEPLRGTVNTPANVKIIAEFVASELAMDFSELAEITSQNTKCLYSLEN